LPWREGADERIAAVIAAELEQNVIVAKYVLIADYTDEDGERGIALNCAPDQRGSETLGLLGYGDTVERARIAAEWADDEPDA